ncbi:RhuM family protein [Pedobacter sp. MC2016-24]|uniref:RhuM family protein n=1 Tax=Pedobacter sp. MC2016-24 TaxID=2780090 RepID=UPI00187EE6AC|nr:virulence RhuM family protein [Pedobacter sp. MC2016-24]
MVKRYIRRTYGIIRSVGIELEEASTCAKFAQVQTEVSRTIKREISHYNLDLIISVGYSVNS